MRNATPRALLLDYGSVISISAFERHTETERILQLVPGSLTWLGPFDPTTDPLWASMQREEITEREYWAFRADELGLAVGESGWDMFTMAKRLRGADPNSGIRPEMQHLVQRARASGIRVGVLSNEFELFTGVGMGSASRAKCSSSTINFAISRAPCERACRRSSSICATCRATSLRSRPG